MIACCCQPPCHSVIKRKVVGCSSVALSGVSVSLTSSDGYTASGTTDGSGQVTLDIYTASGATGTITYGSTGLYAGNTETLSMPCTTASTYTNHTLTPITGYSCSADNCCTSADQSGPPYVNPLSYPSTTYLTDATGTITLNRVTGYGRVVYVGSATRSAYMYGAYDAGGTNTCRVLNGPHDVGLLYIVSCRFGGGWALTIYGDKCYTVGFSCGNVSGTYGAYTVVYPSVAGDASCVADISNVDLTQIGVGNDSVGMGSMPHCPGYMLAGTFVLSVRQVLGGGTYGPRADSVATWVYGDPTFSTATATFTWTE